MTIYIPYFLVFLLGLAVISAAITDLRRRIIPNLISLGCLSAGLFCQAYLGGLGQSRSWKAMLVQSGHGLDEAFLGILVFALPLLLISLGKGMGWGDVKLAAGIGAVLGFKESLHALVVTSLAGAVLALIVLIKHKSLKQGLKNSATTLTGGGPAIDEQGRAQKLSLPYAVAIAIGTLWVLVL